MELIIMHFFMKLKMIMKLRLKHLKVMKMKLKLKHLIVRFVVPLKGLIVR